MLLFSQIIVNRSDCLPPCGRSTQRNRVNEGCGIPLLSTGSFCQNLSTEQDPSPFASLPSRAAILWAAIYSPASSAYAADSSAILLKAIHAADTHHSRGVRTSTRVEKLYLYRFQSAENLSLDGRWINMAQLQESDELQVGVEMAWLRF